MGAGRVARLGGGRGRERASCAELLAIEERGERGAGWREEREREREDQGEGKRERERERKGEM